jgi:hypothetical protein
MVACADKSKKSNKTQEIQRHGDFTLPMAFERITYGKWLLELRELYLEE